jgi:hypothetical protein
MLDEHVRQVSHVMPVLVGQLTADVFLGRSLQVAMNTASARKIGIRRSNVSFVPKSKDAINNYRVSTMHMPCSPQAPRDPSTRPPQCSLLCKSRIKTETRMLVQKPGLLHQHFRNGTTAI